MKKILVLLVGASLLTSCADLFESNYFASLDVPPAVTAATFKDVTATQLTTQAKNPAFYTQMKSSPEAFAAVKTTLKSAYEDVSDKPAAAEAARTFVAVVANSTETVTVVGNFVASVLPQAASLGSLSSDPTAMQTLAVGLFSDAEGTPFSKEETKAALLSMLEISSALNSLSAVTDADNPFFPSGDTSAGLTAQIGIVSGAMTALMAGTGEDLNDEAGRAAAVESVLALLEADDPSTVLSDPAYFDNAALTSSFTDLAGAFTGSASAEYAYMGNLKDLVPIPGL